jgi:hypothetical protein
LKCVTEDLVEDVVDPSTAAQLLGRNFERRSFNRRNEVAGEFGHELENERALVVSFTQAR